MWCVHGFSIGWNCRIYLQRLSILCLESYQANATKWTSGRVDIQNPIAAVTIAKDCFHRFEVCLDCFDSRQFSPGDGCLHDLILIELLRLQVISDSPQ